MSVGIAVDMRLRWALFLRLRREIGTAPTLAFALKRLLGQAPRIAEPHLPARKNEVVGFYSFVLNRPFGEGPVPEGTDRTLNWVIPDFNVGSGGHTTIFRLIQHLERAGYSCRIVIDGPCHFPDAASARNCIREHFFPLEATVTLGRRSLRPAWATFATSWITAYTVRDFQATAEKFYLVQDYEPGFYAMGSEFVFAENTYRMGFRAITAGDWLAGMVRERYGMDARAFGFGVDREYYRPAPRPEDGHRRVFFYARPVTQRRGFELGLLALQVLDRRVSGLHVVFAGWDLSGYHIPFSHSSLGTVSPKGLGEAIAGSDAALVLSLTNLSLLPLEVMACGCPLVSNDGPHVEWMLVDGENAVLTQACPEALAEGLERVLTDPSLRERLVRGGLARAGAADWEQEAGKVQGYLDALAQEPVAAG